MNKVSTKSSIESSISLISCSTSLSTTSSPHAVVEMPRRATAVAARAIRPGLLVRVTGLSLFDATVVAEQAVMFPIRESLKRLVRICFGYSSNMIRTLARTAKRLVSPASRPAALLLAWTHRYTVALWCRSITTEARQQLAQGKPDLPRSRKLLASLWRVSTDSRLANAPELRRISIDDEGLTVEAVETWQGRFLLDTRLGISAVTVK